MKSAERINSITRYVSSTYKKGSEFKSYPREILDLVIFHKIHFFMMAPVALQSYRRLKSNFVDWNEVRISSVREIQEVLGSSPDTLEIAIFIKNLLEFLHQRRHSMDMEFLAEENITEIRRFLRQVSGMDATTINLVLRLRKDYPVIPISSAMENTFVRLGLVRRKDSRDQKGKYLHGLISDDIAIPFHHFFLQHSREICPPEEDQLKCSTCRIRSSCNYYSHKTRTQKTRAQKVRTRVRRSAKKR